MKTSRHSPLPRDNGKSRTDNLAVKIRELVTLGVFSPGQHLSESVLVKEFDVSRNTLREVFRLLSQEGLLVHKPNKGVFVTVPDISTIMDVYRVRRFIESGALLQAYAHHPALEKMRQAVVTARQYREKKDWIGVGSANIIFHTALVELADSPRLSAFYAEVSTELRLVFGLLKDPEALHVPFIEQNGQIVTLLQAGERQKAVALLEDYLGKAERMILSVYAAQIKTI